MKYVSEDTREWLKQKWVRIGPGGKVLGACGDREEGEGKPKCLPLAKAQSMDKKDLKSAVARKRKQDPNVERKGKAKFVSTFKEELSDEDIKKAKELLTGPVKEPKPGSPSVKTYLKMLKGLQAHNDIHKGPVLVKDEYLIEKNEPTNPKLWSQSKSLAKKKFKIYPSAYANLWASKWYKKKGGGWKTLKEERQSTMKTTKDLFLEQLDIAQYGHIVEKDDGKDHEYEMARSQLKTSATAIKRLMEKLGQGEGNLQAWVQSKLTKASDYIDSVADYMDAKDPVVKEAVELSNQVKELFDEVVEDYEEETEVQYVVAKEGHKLDCEIIESYEVKSNGRVKVKTSSGTGYIKEEDIALYEEEQGRPLGEFTHPETRQKVLGMHHGVTDNGSHKIKIISGDNLGERMTVSPNDLSKKSHLSLRQSINNITLPSKLPKPSIEALVSMTADPRSD